MLRIDDEDFPEFRAEIAAFAQIVDQLPHRDMFRHGHQIALHDAPGRFFGEGQRAFDRGAVFRLQLGQHRLLVSIVHFLDDRDGVVGLKLPRQPGHARGGQGIDNVITDIIVHLGQHLGADQITDRYSQNGALIVRYDLEQICNVGVVQLLDEGVSLLSLPVFQRIEHAAHEAWRQQIIVVMRFHAAIELIVPGQFSDVGHGAFPLRLYCGGVAASLNTRTCCNAMGPMAQLCRNGWQAGALIPRSQRETTTEKAPVYGRPDSHART